MKVKAFSLIIMLSMMLFGCGKEQDKVVINYCKSLEAGKLDEAETYLSKSAKQVLANAGGKPVLAAAANIYKTRKGIKKIKISKSTVSGNTAMINLTYNFNDGSTAQDYFPLVKEDGKWKISP